MPPEHKDIVSLREYVEALIAKLDARYSERLRANEDTLKRTVEYAEKASAKAEAAADKRFESVNEFRDMLNDVVRNMIPRHEAERMHDIVEEHHKSVMARLDTMMPRSESDHRYTALAERVGAISLTLEKREATGYGMQKSWGILAGALGMAAATIATFFLVLQHILSNR